jgi:hypothetical protein
VQENLTIDILKFVENADEDNENYSFSKKFNSIVRQNQNYFVLKKNHDKMTLGINC